MLQQLFPQTLWSKSNHSINSKGSMISTTAEDYWCSYSVRRGHPTLSAGGSVRERGGDVGSWADGGPLVWFGSNCLTP